MPIYAYRCGSCGHAKDMLQRISDPLLTLCPACGAEAFAKQLTAAGFQLKGSGWYATDFRGGNNAPAADAGPDAKADPKADAKPAAAAAANTGDAPKKEATSASTDRAGSSSPSAPSS